jgi:hypothetical protein
MGGSTEPKKGSGSKKADSMKVSSLTLKHVSVDLMVLMSPETEVFQQVFPGTLKL